MRIRLFDPAANPRFDDLPWSTPLAQWDHPRLVDMPVGLHRHVVRFVEYSGEFFALKELPQRLAEREYRLLRTMNDRGLPVVAAVALVDQRGELDAVLITRYLHYAVPFRLLFAEAVHAADAADVGDVDVAGRVVESIATLLARLHSAGFSWGDCSLSNALFRRDELHLSGYALDTETGELHDDLSDGQRRADVDLAVVNVAGGLADLAAAGQLPADVDPFEVAPLIETRYDEIWELLHGALLYDPDDPTAFDHRLDDLHDLGFGVSEAVITDTTETDVLRFRPAVITGAYQRRELVDLTGITAREHQAQRLLDEIREFRDRLPQDGGSRRSLRDIGHQWLTEVYDPVLATVPTDIAGKLERPQLFIEILDHHDAGVASDVESTDRAVQLSAAARRYVDDVLSRRPHERTQASRPADPPTND